MKLRFLLFGLIILYFGCETSTESIHATIGEKVIKPLNLENYFGFRLGDTITVALEDTLTNSDENIWVTFDSLLSDSRCPINVMCFWEGNAEVLIMFSNNEYVYRFKLNTHRGFEYEKVLYGYKISLVDLLPYPHADSIYVESDYSAQIVIESVP